MLGHSNKKMTMVRHDFEHVLFKEYKGETQK